MVEHLSQTIGNRNFRQPEQLERAAGYIISYFKSIGYVVSLHSYQARGQVFKNIIAHDGTGRSERNTLYIGAHYDSCFNPGADDNASGIAGMLMLAKLLKDEEIAVPIRFIAFVNEEPPFFMTESMGSRVFTRALKQGDEKVMGAIILEMIGYYRDQPFSQRYLPFLGPFFPNRGNFVAAIGNFSSQNLLRQVKEHYPMEARVPMEFLVVPSILPGANFSDHWSFWQEGYPGVMITDTAYMRNPHYHKKTDLSDTLDYERMALVISGMKRVIQEMKEAQINQFSLKNLSKPL